MCGIIGVLAKDRPAAPLLMDGLRRLEYRGYDSAGVATVSAGFLDRRRAAGKLAALADVLGTAPLPGTSGIGHTRWATHGCPTEANAHPHRAGSVCVVHNGIIENYRTLREELTSRGAHFESDTDTEVIAILCADMLRRGLCEEDAAAGTIARLEGTYALCFLFETAPDLLICARRGSPLVIGLGDGETFVGSDAIALAPLTNRICYLEEGDWAVVSRTDMRVHDSHGNPVTRRVQVIALDHLIADKGQHRHFMAKEIHEQPTVLARALGAWTSSDRNRITSDAEHIDWSAVSRLSIVACGTAYLAGHVAKIWLEQIARLPVELEIASEFRYREPPLPRDGVTMVISQSGETADTLAALRYAKAQGQQTLGLVNVTTSTIAREADVVLPIHAGPEIGVASTKAFTAQLMCIALLAFMIARKRGVIGPDAETTAIDVLSTIPRILSEVLAQENDFAALAAQISDATSVLFLGRGMMYPLALEGALKLKEITYIHAEGYAAGEIKHGPIALVDEHTPIIALAPSGPLLEKSLSNLREVIARNGRVAIIGDAAACQVFGNEAWHCLAIPHVDPLVAPFAYAVAIQFLAYHTALCRGTDVDQPRNLAKSVTVE
ncbi:glutamine--fructose-6-phosphate transaminase [Loktanella salsilacus]|jgi:glucosamine--fructose-6-phosphate aminotransferase (isomerizing)|uniref:Glutamine--fructose-6-phosphate aminotransferase [isomerizing] n=1 Tax=Loktanella salsilacus TaxID=195913 RepID=A0A1I4JJQ0_9RHOB|nr:glutamine--fructose-6-phosphate transaminase (isomerizing) [Loktanella salsilacus]SFL66336.1 glutamine--fructose-6-phosphate transaminase [Loktanella salsilacus]